MSATGDDHQPTPPPHEGRGREARPDTGPAGPAGPRSGPAGRHPAPEGQRPGPEERAADPEGDADGGSEPVLPSRPRTPLTQQLGRITLVVLAVLFVVFAVANSQPVDFSWIFGTTEVVQGPGEETSGGVPLIVLLVVAFVMGAAIGALVEWQFLRARRDRKGAPR